MFRSLLILVAILIAIPLYATDMESVIRRDQPTLIKHESGQVVNAIYGEIVAGNVVWKFLPDSHFIRKDTETYLAAPPGDYLVVFGDSQILKVIEEGQPSPPNPKPDPPSPKPDPDDDQEQDNPIIAEWVIYVGELTDSTKDVQQIMAITHPDTKTLVSETLGLKLRVYDKDEKAGKSYAKFVAEANQELPALVIMGKNVKDYKIFPAPKTVQDIEKLIRSSIVR